jgi:hypothetical protein
MLAEFTSRVLQRLDATDTAIGMLGGDVGRLTGRLESVEEALKELRKRDSDRPVSHHDLERFVHEREETTSPGMVAEAVAAGVAAGIAAAPHKEGENPVLVIVTTVINGVKWLSKAKAVWIGAGLAGLEAARWYAAFRHWL